MKAVMYHYVRPETAELPYLRYLHIEDFRRQLDHFAQAYGFVSRGTFLDSLDGVKAPPEGVVLTFDDGFVDHFEWVLPELEARGLWGLFYVPTGYYETGAILDAHRVHYLLGRFGGHAALKELRGLLSDSMVSEDYVATFETPTYQHQINDESTTLFKRTLNYYVKEADRGGLIDALWARLLPGVDLDGSLYMSPDMLRHMCDRGMILGSHTVTHPVLSKLDESAQRREIVASFAKLNELTGDLALRTFCYPYGGFHNFNDVTERVLAKAGCRFAFNVESRDVASSDLRDRPFALPRYDCNQFPHGQPRPLPE